MVIEKAGKIGEKGVSTNVQNEEKAVCGEQQGVAEKSIRRQKRKNNPITHATRKSIPGHRL